MDLIRRHTELLDKKLCHRIIKEFEVQHSLGCTRERHDDIRRDTQINFNTFDESNFRNTEIASEFFEFLQTALGKYVQDLGLQKTFPNGLWFKDMLVQRSRADSFESYSTWHCEVSETANTERVLVYTLYLNDDYEGGETQFMYQKHNEKPEAGKLVMFPAFFTHMHRGNMITKGTKYLVTGWCFY